MKTRSKEEICQALAADLMDYIALIVEGQQDPPDAIRLYTYDDLAQMLGKSKSTVREWVRAGKFGEPVTVGSSTRVTQAGLDKFIADHSGPTKKRESKVRQRTAHVAVNPKGLPLGI